VLKAFGLGTFAQSSLLFAGLLVCWVTVPRRVVGVAAGFGAGAMLSAVSFDLVAEASDLDFWAFGLWMLIGVAVFLLGDRFVERRFARRAQVAPWGSSWARWSTACRSP
jgi:ZIP family zinc transporter